LDVGSLKISEKYRRLNKDESMLACKVWQKFT
jgi:hypothetical protein